MMTLADIGVLVAAVPVITAARMYAEQLLG